MHALVLFFLLALSSATGARRLQFNEGGTFKVVQFTDLHFGSGYEGDLQTLAVQGTVLEKEKPDLVVITGDLVSGYMWKGDSDFFYNHWNQLIQPMVSRNISWAIALGNHDIEADLTASEIVALDSSHPLSLTERGPTTIGGAGNYHLPIYLNSSTDEVGQMLWIFDSGQSGCQGVHGWGCVQSSQIAWYKNESSFLTGKNNTHPIPGMAFFHIPLYEHLDLWNSKPVYGNLGESEGVCCSSLNTGLYSAMHEMGDIKHVFCGHDHSNDYYGDYNGIHLGYGRKSGFGGYGPPRGWKHGARVIEITQNSFAIKTWLRLEDGSVEVQPMRYPGSSHQFMGCCDMEGHGKDAVVSLFVYLVNAAWLTVAISGLVAGRLAYLRCKRRREEYTGLEETGGVN